MNETLIDVDPELKRVFLVHTGGLEKDFDSFLSQAVDELPSIASLISMPRELQGIVNALRGKKKIVAPKDRAFRRGDAMLLVWNSGLSTGGVEDPVPIDLGIVMNQAGNRDLDVVILGLLEVSPLPGNPTYPPTNKTVERRPVYAKSSVVLPLNNRRRR